MQKDTLKGLLDSLAAIDSLSDPKWNDAFDRALSKMKIDSDAVQAALKKSMPENLEEISGSLSKLQLPQSQKVEIRSLPDDPIEPQLLLELFKQMIGNQQLQIDELQKSNDQHAKAEEESRKRQRMDRAITIVTSIATILALVVTILTFLSDHAIA